MTGLRAALRRQWYGFQTLFGIAQRGVFIPYRHADGLPAAGRRDAYPAVTECFAAAESDFAAVLDGLEDYAEDLVRIGESGPPAPRWDQDWFPTLDAAVAYGFVRRLAPRRIVEVGSGHSTRFLMRAAADAGLPLTLTAIDPAPRATLAALPGVQLELLRSTVERLGLELFATLTADDLLSVDSSHLLLPGSDVDVLLGSVLPVLPVGITVHFHDVFLPDDYPRAWRWRGYNEQLGLLPLILSGGWQPLFASHYVASRQAERLARGPLPALPQIADAKPSSLWLRKTGPAVTAK